MTFDDFPLKQELIQAVNEIGFEVPTRIQEEVIRHMLEDDADLIGLAQTGTGKTAAYGLPILHNVELEQRYPQAVVLGPTRELCVQITGDIISYGKYLKGLSVVAVYGGASMTRQREVLRRGAQVIVATPGRLLDLLQRGDVVADRVRYLVLDEADIMLNMGFKEEMDAILASIPGERRTLLLSATMPGEVARIASEYMRDPTEVRVGERNAGAVTVEHGYYMVHARDKYLALKRIVDFHPDMYAIVFCRTRAATQEIADRMIKDGYNAEALHGEMAQTQRDIVMRKFRDRTVQLLVATDIAARGLDVDDLSHVIHYDLPDEPEIYTHRSGRTGRAGKSGVSLAIVNMKEKYKLRRIESNIKGRFSYIDVPTGDQICERQLMHLVDRVKAVEIDEAKIAGYMPVIQEKLAGLSREELLGHFVSLEFNRFLDYYHAAAELRPIVDRTEMSGGRSPGKNRARAERTRVRRTASDFATIRLNIGRKDRIAPPDIIGIINRATRGSSVDIGRIEITETESYCQIEKPAVGSVISAVAGQSFRGRKLQVSAAQGTASGEKRPYARKGRKKK